MKNSEIRIGSEYIAKVTGKPVRVRIDAAVASGGWNATNLLTNRQVRIKSAGRLQAIPESIEQVAKHETSSKDETQAKQIEAVQQIKVTSPVEKKTKMSGLDAASLVLEEVGEPMNTRDIVDMAKGYGYCNPAGKTPHATLYSAILREISLKGENSRFRKAEQTIAKRWATPFRLLKVGGAFGLSRSLVTGDGPNFATASVSLQKMLMMIREIKQAARIILNWIFNDWLELTGWEDKTLQFLFNDLDPSDAVDFKRLLIEFYDRKPSAVRACN